MKTTRATAWSSADIDVLRTVYPRGGALAVWRRLPGRSVGAIGSMARKLEIRRVFGRRQERGRAWRKQMREAAIAAGACRHARGRLPETAQAFVAVKPEDL